MEQDERQSGREDLPAGAGPDDLAEQFADLARGLEEQKDVQATLDALVAAAAGTIPGAQHVSLSSVRRRREVVTRASTNDLPRETDRAQYETAQGPCLDTLFEEQTVRIPDLAAETRWPEFTARARELGAGSMLSVQLYVNGSDGDLGALNLLNEEPHAFDAESEHVALLFAAHAAVAMVGAEQQEHLRSALGTRDVIGQAKGILMERFKITPDQAFGLLSAASQQTNRKLSDVAEALTQTGELRP